MSGLTNEDRKALAVAVHGLTCHSAFGGGSCGVADMDDRHDADDLAPAVEQIVARHVAEARAAALNEAAEFIRDTSGIGAKGNVFADGWYAALDYAIGELRNRAAIPQTSPLPEVGLSPPGS